MIQDFDSCRVSRSGEADRVQAFADRQRLKTRFDDDGTRIIPGKFGQIYEYGAGRLAVMVMPDSHRKNLWGCTRSRLKSKGFLIVQDGDCEGAAVFDPANPEQVKVAIRAAGIKRKRCISPAQRDKQIACLQASAGRAL